MTNGVNKSVFVITGTGPTGLFETVNILSTGPTSLAGPTGPGSLAGGPTGGFFATYSQITGPTGASGPTGNFKTVIDAGATGLAGARTIIIPGYTRGGAGGFSAFDPATVAAGALSINNTVFTGNFSGTGGAFGATPRSAGKLYFEMQVTAKGNNGNGTDGFGVAGPTAAFAGLGPSVAQHGLICFANSGDCYANGSLKGNANGGGSAPSAGFWYGIGVDFTANTLRIQELTGGGTAVTGLALPVESSFTPAVVVTDSASASSFTLNTGGSAFIGTLPAGYSAWG